MGNRDVFDEDASVFKEISKLVTSECSSKVGDDAIWETESVDVVFKELDSFLCSSRNKRFVFDPLGEPVDDDIHVPETTWRRLEKANHLQSLACKRPRS